MWSIVHGIRKKESADRYCKDLLEKLASAKVEEFSDPGITALWITHRPKYSYVKRGYTDYWRVDVSNDFYEELRAYGLHQYPYVPKKHTVRKKKETPNAATGQAGTGVVAVGPEGAGGEGGATEGTGGEQARQPQEATVTARERIHVVTGIDHATRTVTLGEVYMLNPITGERTYL